MFKIIVKDEEGYEYNYYSKDYVIEIHKDVDILSYINAFISALRAEGFLISTIRNGLSQGASELQEELDVYCPDRCR